MTHPRALAVLNAVLVLGIVVWFWRSSLAEHGDANVYLEASAAMVRGDRLYYAVLTWIEQGYWIGDPRPAPTPFSPYVYPPPLTIVVERRCHCA